LHRSPSCFEGEEAQSQLDEPFNEAMVLLDQVVEIFDLPQFHALREKPSGFEVSHRFGIGGVLINVDDTWCCFGGLMGIGPEGVNSLLIDYTGSRG